MVTMETSLTQMCVLIGGFIFSCYGQAQDGAFILSDFKNITAKEGTVVKIPCSSSGYPTPRQIWTHNNRTVTSAGQKARVRITSKGTLRFRSVKVADEGWYTCTAENVYGRDVSPRIFLKVEAPAQIIQGPNSTTTNWGTTVTLSCEVQGHPTPHLEWRKNNVAVPDPVSGKLYSSAKLVVNVTENATYTCKTQNILSHGVTRDEATATVTYNENTRPLGYCSSERIAVCEKHLPGSSPVFYGPEKSTEEISTTLSYLFETVIKRYDPVCRHAIQSLLCRHAFPECQMGQNHLHKSKPICRESCIQVTSVLCPDVDWEDLHYHTMTHIQSQAAHGDTPAPDANNWPYIRPQYCNNLPLHEALTETPQGDQIMENSEETNNSSDQSNIRRNQDVPNGRHNSNKKNDDIPTKLEGQSKDDQCSSFVFYFARDELSTDICFDGDGHSYQGNVNTTKTGKNCVLWSEIPDQGGFKIHNKWSHNYCRNPGGLKERPWCFIDSPASPDLHWEYCPLLKCSQEVNASNIHSGDSVEGPDDVFFTMGFISTLIACTASCLCVLAVVMGCTYKRRSNSHNRFQGYRKPTKQDQMLRSLSIDITKMSKNGFYHHRLSSVSSTGKLEKLEFPRNEITYLEDIADGAFGKLFLAKARCFIRGSFENQLIAVKTLRENSTSCIEEELIKEAELMVELDHPNILKLLGVCLQEKPLCLIYEYMNERDLQSFLRRKAPPEFPLKRTSTSPDGQKAYLSTCDLMDISMQTCAGIMYLANKGFVHRDLATRNCLIADNLVVKISDFALIQSTEYKNYFRGKDYDPIPIRWMPLEAILMNQFTTYSDIWSFGVVLWEIFSFAQQPYYGLSHEEVVDFLKQGRVLPPPEDTPKEIYGLMKQCWNYKADQRISFAALYTALSCCKQELSDKSQHSV